MVVGAVQFQFYGQDRSRETEIRESLSAAGIHPESGENGERIFGVFCFSQIDDGLFAAFQQFRFHSRSRIIALAATSLPLENSVTWRLLHGGASDILTWTGRLITEQVRARLNRWSTVEELTARALARQSMVGQGPAWTSLVRRVVEAARFSSVPVLLTGKSGTGKELLAGLIHSVSSEGKAGELITLDCSTIVAELSGSELFGHERGAFTGAHALREGAFALADGATLFLDEIGELPLPLQAQLLRAIQEKTYKRVGGNVWYKTNFRLVCATNRDLGELVRNGQFRLDLYHRIAGWVFHTLPISERREDILPLARHFLGISLRGDTPEFDSAVREYLLNRPYEGNVRELRLLIDRIAHRHAGSGPITVGDIPEEDRPSGNAVMRVWPDPQLDRTIEDAIALGASLREISTAATQAAIRIAVQSEDGNLQRAARRLGVTDRALQLRRAAGQLGE